MALLVARAACTSSVLHKRNASAVALRAGSRADWLPLSGSQRVNVAPPSSLHSRYLTPVHRLSHTAWFISLAHTRGILDIECLDSSTAAAAAAVAPCYHPVALPASFRRSFVCSLVLSDEILTMY